MKNKLFLFIIVIALSNMLQAQKNLITVRPGNFVMGLYGVSYERALIKWFSVGAYVDIQNTNETNGNVNFKATGVGFIPEARFYLSIKGAPKGFFLGAYLPFRSVDATINIKGNLGDVVKASSLSTSSQDIKGTATINQKSNLAGIGFMLGHQFLIAKIVSIGYYVGAAYTNGLLGSSVKATFKTDNPGQQSTADSAIQTLNGSGSTSTSFEAEVPQGLQTFSKVIPRIGISLGVAF